MDRKLIISVSKPCKLEKYLLPNELDWTFNISNYNNLKKHELNIGYDNHFVRYKLPSIDFTDYYKHTDIILIKTGFNLIKHLTLNKKHHEKIKSIGYSIETFNIESLYFEWMIKLFKFSDKLQIKYNQMLKLLRHKTNLICAQIRIGGLDDFEFTTRSKIIDYWKFLRENFELNNNSKIFITSDREDIIDEASQEFSNETIIAFKNRSFQLAKKNEINKESECDKISELYLDFFFLRECNQGIISHSGFGLIGILNRKNKTDLNKFYVYTNPNQLMNDWSDRSTLSFYKFNSSFLYLEFRYLL